MLEKLHLFLLVLLQTFKAEENPALNQSLPPRRWEGETAQSVGVYQGLSLISGDITEREIDTQIGASRGAELKGVAPSILQCSA